MSKRYTLIAHQEDMPFYISFRKNHAIASYVFAVALALLVAVMAGCGSSGGGGNAPTLERSTSFTVLTKDLGVIETNCDIMMRDGGNSALINGRSVWLYGDTFLALPNADNQRLLSNSSSSTFDGDAGDGIYGFEEIVDDVGVPLKFFPFTEEESAFNQAHEGDYCNEEPCKARWAIWPGAIVVDDQRGLAYFFYGKFYVEPGEFNFDCTGRSIAVWRTQGDAGPVRPIYERVENYPTLLFSSDQPRFGSAAVSVGNLVYVYGCALDKSTLTKPCHIARVPIEKILERDAWAYYSSDGTWSPVMDLIEPVLEGNSMMSVFYNTYLERYIAIYTEPLKNHIMLRVADKPEGPWSSPRRVWTAREPVPSGWIYDALAHPEYSRNNNRVIYVTYSRKTAQFKSEMRLISVELMIEP